MLKTLVLIFLVICLQKIVSYEIIVERIETALGDDDELFIFETLRVKKFNRTA
jgi:hypothetical protein